MEMKPRKDYGVLGIGRAIGTGILFRVKANVHPLKGIKTVRDTEIILFDQKSFTVLQI
jgi:hypothetical protein